MENMQNILFDHGRTGRIGLPEAVLCEGKSTEAVQQLLTKFCNATENPILFTRLHPDLFASMPPAIQACYDYHQLSHTAFTAPLPPRPKVQVAVVSAGTADGRTTWEAVRTLQYMGVKSLVFEDNGVAGLWRLTKNLEQIQTAQVVIVVAGLDAALASILGGLTGKPIFAVPTSVGYGMAEQGKAALTSMLVSCAPGVGVMNIDNGYGAACAAVRILNLLAEPGTRHE